jgi:hypothetical protein
VAADEGRGVWHPPPGEARRERAVGAVLVWQSEGRHRSRAGGGCEHASPTGRAFVGQPVLWPAPRR